MIGHQLLPSPAAVEPAAQLRRGSRARRPASGSRGRARCSPAASVPVPHEPRHSTSAIENTPSSVISPGRMSSFSSKARTSGRAPARQHERLAHTWRWKLADRLGVEQRVEGDHLLHVDLRDLEQCCDLCGRPGRDPALVLGLDEVQRRQQHGALLRILRKLRRDPLLQLLGQRPSQSPIALAADHVDHVEGRDDVRQHLALDHARQGLRVGEAGRARAQLVRACRCRRSRGRSRARRCRPRPPGRPRRPAASGPRSRA